MARFYSCIHSNAGTSVIVLLLLSSTLIPGGGVSSLHAQQNAIPASPGPVFRKVATYSTEGLDSRIVAVGDINGDGKLDLVFTTCQDVTCVGGSVVARLGNGDGTFRRALVSFAGNGAPNSMVVGDFNHDGKPDLGVASLCVPVFGGIIGEVHGLAGNGDGTFGDSFDFATAALCPYFVAVGDFNLDGNLDLAVTYFCLDPSGCTDAAVAVFLGTGKGDFQGPVFYHYGGASPYFLAVADFNGDGNPDLVVGDGSGIVTLLSGNGDGTFQVGTSFAAPAGFWNHFVVGDFNGDGKPDLAGASGKNSIALLLGNGDGTFQSPITINASPGTFAAADFNEDGKLDLAVIRSDGITVLLGNGHGKFRAVHGADGVPGILSAAVGDFNSDGKPDLAVDDDSNVTVLLNVY